MSGLTSTAFASTEAPPIPSPALLFTAVFQFLFWPALMWVGIFTQMWQGSAVVFLPTTVLYLLLVATVVAAVWYRSSIAAQLLHMFFSTASAVALLISVLFWLMAFVSMGMVWVSAAAWLLPVFIACVWSSDQFKRWHERLLQWECNRMHCLRCGYNLIATLHDERPTCPECGTPIPDWVVEHYRFLRESNGDERTIESPSPGSTTIE
ncbi:MAG: hypothetical protein WD768_14875 [Phycisphaeraceae bacterium]